MKVSTKKIIEQYHESKDIYDDLKDDLEDIFTSIIKTNHFRISNLSVRIKKEDTLKKKIIYKNKYKDITEITDIVAARIITLFEDDINRLFECVKENFDIIEYNDKRKKNYDDRIDFGYNSLHLLLKFTESRCQLIEYQKYKDIVFELQIRTILQHSWAEIEHGLGYKSQYEIPKDIRRKLTRLSATLELLDEEFVTIAKEVDEYNKGIEHVEKIMKTDINVNSLIQYVNNSMELNKIFTLIQEKNHLKIEKDENLISELRIVKRLHVLGYSYIHELDDFVKNNIKEIEWIAEQLTDYIKDNVYLNYYHLLTWIMLVMFGKEGLSDPENVLEKEVINRLKGEAYEKSNC